MVIGSLATVTAAATVLAQIALVSQVGTALSRGGLLVTPSFAFSDCTAVLHFIQYIRWFMIILKLKVKIFW